MKRGYGVGRAPSFDRHLSELLRGSGVALAGKTFGALAAFALNVVFARWLGTTQFGLYVLAVTIAVIVATISRLGLDNVLVRTIAADSARGHWSEVAILYGKAVRLTLLASVLLALPLAVVAEALSVSIFSDPGLTVPLRVLALAVPAVALIAIHGESLRGLRQVGTAQLVKVGFLPVIAILLGLAMAVADAREGSVAYVLAAWSALGLAIVLWRRLGVAVGDGKREPFPVRRLLEQSLPMLMVAILGLVMTWTATLLLGVWASAQDVALFSVANRTAMLIALLLGSVNAMAGPQFATLHEAANLVALERVARHTALLMGLVATPLVAIMLFAPGWVLTLFGPEYADASMLLRWLGLAQLVNVFCGSVGLLLMMTGQEKVYRSVSMLAAILYVLLCVLLIPGLGALGAALATGISLVALNVLSAIAVHRRLAIVPLPFLPAMQRHRDSPG